jgi:hypothetical protein
MHLYIVAQMVSSFPRQTVVSIDRPTGRPCLRAQEKTFLLSEQLVFCKTIVFQTNDFYYREDFKFTITKFLYT